MTAVYAQLDSCSASLCGRCRARRQVDGGLYRDVCMMGLWAASCLFNDVSSEAFRSLSFLIRATIIFSIASPCRAYAICRKLEASCAQCIAMCAILFNSSARAPNYARQSKPTRARKEHSCFVRAQASPFACAAGPGTAWCDLILHDTASPVNRYCRCDCQLRSIHQHPRVGWQTQHSQLGCGPVTCCVVHSAART